MTKQQNYSTFPTLEGPLVDKHAKNGDPKKFQFPISNVKEFDFSFSGLKTSLLYFLKKELAKDEHFIDENLDDICASYQYTIVKSLFKKLVKACKEYEISHVAIAGGVSANSHLRSELERIGRQEGWKTYIPKFEYCTDNAAMIAITGHYKYLNSDFVGQDIVPNARMKL